MALAFTSFMVHCNCCFQVAPVCTHGDNPATPCAFFTPDVMLASVYLALCRIARDTPPGDARCVCQFSIELCGPGAGLPCSSPTVLRECLQCRQGLSDILDDLLFIYRIDMGSWSSLQFRILFILGLRCYKLLLIFPRSFVEFLVVRVSVLAF